MNPFKWCAERRRRKLVEQTLINAQRKFWEKLLDSQTRTDAQFRVDRAAAARAELAQAIRDQRKS